VVVSGLERATYPGPGLDKFGELGRLEFREGDARLYRFDP
jgi:hypothetical protein